jgi:hypothetical protein
VVDERRKLERELTEARKKLALAAVRGGEDGVPRGCGRRFPGRVVTGVEPKDLKSLADEARSRSVPASSCSSASRTMARPASWLPSPTI